MTRNILHFSGTSALIITAIVFSLLLPFSGCGSIREMKEFADTVNYTDPQLNQLDDGVYAGECAKGPISVKVSVLISDHKIDSIDILEHKNGKGKKAEKIIEDVLDRQTLHVDVISGASYSSKVILKALENALTLP